MCRCREADLNCVRMATSCTPELRQLLRGMSIRRYLPAMGTAGLARSRVSGHRRVPRPPPRMMPKTRPLDMEDLSGQWSVVSQHQLPVTSDQSNVMTDHWSLVTGDW